MIHAKRRAYVGIAVRDLRRNERRVTEIFRGDACERRGSSDRTTKLSLCSTRSLAHGSEREGDRCWTKRKSHWVTSVKWQTAWNQCRPQWLRKEISFSLSILRDFWRICRQVSNEMHWEVEEQNRKSNLLMRFMGLFLWRALNDSNELRTASRAIPTTASFLKALMNVISIIRRRKKEIETFREGGESGISQ